MAREHDVVVLPLATKYLAVLYLGYTREKGGRGTHLRLPFHLYEKNESEACEQLIDDMERRRAAEYPLQRRLV
jgi:hypothetical protein